MNRRTKLFFMSLFIAIAILAVNVIAKGETPEIFPNEKEKPATHQETRKQARKTKPKKAAMEEWMPKGKETSSTIRLKRYAYSLLYDKETRLPRWVAWHLTANHIYGAYKREGLKFEEDEEVPLPRATNADYSGSGYDRGHMCPSGDNRWDERAQRESFLYTNCCPQYHDLNSEDWEELESKCRDWAKKYGDIYIVCGPVLYNKKHKTIGKNKVVVPEAFFKVVLCMNGTPKAIGFIYRNEAKHHAMQTYVNTVDEVERITGLDFFPSLPNNVERKVEASASLNDW